MGLVKTWGLYDERRVCGFTSSCQLVELIHLTEVYKPCTGSSLPEFYSIEHTGIELFFNVYNGFIILLPAAGTFKNCNKEFTINFIDPYSICDVTYISNMKLVLALIPFLFSWLLHGDGAMAPCH